MDKKQNHWIALYLSGQYPGFYTLPDRLNFFDEIKLENPTRYTDTILGQYQTKNDVEFFYSLLNSFERNHKNKYEDLLVRLSIPNEVKNDPRIEKKEIKFENNLGVEEIEKYIDGLDEEGFSRYVVMPILQSMGYKDIEYKGKVNETDFGLDFYPIHFISPGGINYYCGVQTKSAKMTNGDTSKSGSEANKLLEETKTAFSQSHELNNGEKIYISEYLIFNSVTVPQSAKTKFFNDKDIKDKKIKYYGKDGVLALINELKIKIN